MRFNDALIGVAVILLGIIVIIHVRSYPDMGDGMPGPSLFPTLLGALLIIAGAVQIPAGIKSRAPLATRLPEFNIKGIGNISLTILSVVFYICASETLGFILTSFCVMLVMMLALKAKPRTSVLVAGGATICIYVIFSRMLLVPLPAGLFSF
jgi:putative tricarboxylic transport membrane protein